MSHFQRRGQHLRLIPLPFAVHQAGQTARAGWWSTGGVWAWNKSFGWYCAWEQYA